jgi:heat shock protein HslJ
MPAIGDEMPAQRLAARLFATVALAGVVALLSIIPAVAQGSWLDRPLVDWNRPGDILPELPEPPEPQVGSADLERCERDLREPQSPAEEALVRRGWRPYGPVQSSELTMVVTALSSFDGMCRPMGFQAFVYWEGRYAGTLSPEPMNSRSDGSLIEVRVRPDALSADFARYMDADPLCCPSRVDTVTYELERDDVPRLTATAVVSASTGQTRPAVQTGGGTGSEPDDAAVLFDRLWILTEMERRELSGDEPNIEFDRAEMRAFGSGGCNRFNGGFETDGSALTFAAIAATSRACPDDDLNEIETSFFQLLQVTTRFEIEGNTLRLFADAKALLTFTSRPADA